MTTLVASPAENGLTSTCVRFPAPLPLLVKTISLTKQFTGYEVGFNVFRFFGSELFDLNIGAKGQEPLQLGVRTALEEATMRLVGAATAVDPAVCLEERRWPPPTTAAAAAP